jgi:hypothetical protein
MAKRNSNKLQEHGRTGWRSRISKEQIIVSPVCPRRFFFRRLKNRDPVSNPNDLCARIETTVPGRHTIFSYWFIYSLQITDSKSSTFRFKYFHRPTPERPVAHRKHRMQAVGAKSGAATSPAGAGTTEQVRLEIRWCRRTSFWQESTVQYVVCYRPL